MRRRRREAWLCDHAVSACASGLDAPRRQVLGTSRALGPRETIRACVVESRYPVLRTSVLHTWYGPWESSRCGWPPPITSLDRRAAAAKPQILPHITYLRSPPRPIRPIPVHPLPVQGASNASGLTRRTLRLPVPAPGNADLIT